MRGLSAYPFARVAAVASCGREGTGLAEHCTWDAVFAAAAARELTTTKLHSSDAGRAKGASRMVVKVYNTITTA